MYKNAAIFLSCGPSYGLWFLSTNRNYSSEEIQGRVGVSGGTFLQYTVYRVKFRAGYRFSYFPEQSIESAARSGVTAKVSERTAHTLSLAFVI